MVSILADHPRTRKLWRKVNEFFIPYGTRPAREREAGNNAYIVVARLMPGVSVEAAAAEVEPILRGDADPTCRRRGRS